MSDTFGLGLITTLLSFALFPAAAALVARGTRLGLAFLWAGWVGGLISYGAFVGAPEMSSVLAGVPLSAAAIAAARSTRLGLARSIKRAYIVTIVLIIPSFALGIWWGIMACQGGCL